ncbi:MAG: hypothetical protein QX189_17640 [Methylococcales bacterium]
MDRPKSHFFPIFGFSLINNVISTANALKSQQVKKLEEAKESIKPQAKRIHSNINSIFSDKEISKSNKNSCILWCALNGHITLDDFEKYLRNYPNKEETDYRKLLCAYDYKKYSENQSSSLDGA